MQSVQTRKDQSQSNRYVPTLRQEQDVELKENVAYMQQNGQIMPCQHIIIIVVHMHDSIIWSLEYNSNIIIQGKFGSITKR